MQTIEDIFYSTNEDNGRRIIREQLQEYTQAGHSFTKPAAIEKYFYLLYHYLVKQRPVSDWNIGSLMKLMGASYVDQGSRSPFWVMASEEESKKPDDLIYAMTRELESNLSNEDIDEAFRFVESEILKEGDVNRRIRKLGALSYNQICFRKNKTAKLRLKDHEKGRRDGSIGVVMKKECERFLAQYTPSKIKEYLDRFVIGQEDTKKVLSTAVYNHFLRILHPEDRLIKSNVLMVGPSGCGKTELIRRISELVNVPVVITDFSGVVATPWRGRNKEEALENLYLKAGRDLERAECGIVFCDEFDKIIPTRRRDIGDDINNELQGQLLGMFEGTELDVPVQDEKGNSGELIMDTTNILFICAGAFEGLDKLVYKDLFASSMGFGGSISHKEDFELTASVLTTEHLIKFGMKPELAGRLSLVTVLRKLDHAAMKRVLTEAEDSVLSRYETEFRMDDDIQLHFTDGALDVVIEKTMEMGIGARGLNAVLRDILSESLYEAPSMTGVQQVVVTEKAARGEERPKYL